MHTMLEYRSICFGCSLNGFFLLRTVSHRSGSRRCCSPGENDRMGCWKLGHANRVRCTTHRKWMTMRMHPNRTQLEGVYMCSSVVSIYSLQVELRFGETGDTRGISKKLLWGAYIVGSAYRRVLGIRWIVNGKSQFKSFFSTSHSSLLLCFRFDDVPWIFERATTEHTVPNWRTGSVARFLFVCDNEMNKNRENSNLFGEWPKKTEKYKNRNCELPVIRTIYWAFSTQLRMCLFEWFRSFNVLSVDSDYFIFFAFFSLFTGAFLRVLFYRYCDAFNSVCGMCVSIALCLKQYLRPIRVFQILPSNAIDVLFKIFTSST